MNTKIKQSFTSLKQLFTTPEPVNPLEKPSLFKKYKYLLLAFFVPFILMFFAYGIQKFYFFHLWDTLPDWIENILYKLGLISSVNTDVAGTNQIMVIDMWHQYFQFFKVLQEKLQTGGSLLYTWEGGLGTNFIALISYYAASPLYLLSIFVPSEYLTELMAMVVILKISFSGMFMYIYLRNMFKLEGYGTSAFAILYALSAYAMGYYWCLMWLDVMALLPLCLLGLNKLIDEGKFRLYCVSLGLIMLSNYYIGVMVCMFIAVYYVALYFSREKEFNWKDCAITTGKTIGFSVLGCCLAAVILIPTYLSMQNTYYIDQAFPQTTNMYNSIMDVLNNMLPNVELTVRGGLPNIYCGLVSVMMAVLYLLCRSVPIRQKVTNVLVLAFLILSFNWNKLDFIWHGFHFPNELPYRYSFVFSFIIVTMAYTAFTKLDDISPAQIGGVAAGGFVYLMITEKIYADEFDYTVIYISLLLLILYSLALAIHKTGKYKETLCGLLIFLIVFGEMTNYTIRSVKAVGNSGRTTYYTHYDDVTALIDTIEKEDDSFYRMELSTNWTCNDPALYGYNGVSQFSSEINCNVTAMMKSMGLEADPGSNSFIYKYSTPVVNSMLNLKYFIGRGTTIVDDTSLTSRYTSNSSTLYENKYPLSIAYMSNTDVLSYTALNNYSNVFENQNMLAWFTSGISTPVFNQLGDPVITATNGSCGAYSNGTVSCSNTGGTTSVTLQYTATTAQNVYAFVEASGASSITAKTSHGQQVSIASNRGSAVALGYAEAGESIYVDVTFQDGQASTIKSLVYGLDSQVWDRVYNALSDEMLNVESWSDTKIKGTVTAQKDGLLMTSIPYEKGWSVKVDGKKVEVLSVADALCAVELTAGEHEIVFSYIPAGFILGVSVSVLSIVALVALHYVLTKKKKVVVISETGEATTGDDIDEMVEEALNNRDVSQNFDSETVQQAVDEITADADTNEAFQQADVNESYEQNSDELNDSDSEE